ncbi:MAG: lauroyl-Kdo(2)-lipid IV(A) myristoyltransferase [Arsenophonus sp.]|nr:MAG: lauroyl-Kdo(2)-lipid IV(A) myristoyltransferase [Arsenophonus sp.]
MNKKKNTNKKCGYIPTFHYFYLFPQYWGTWILAFLLVCVAYLPFKYRDKLLAKLGHLIGKCKLAKSARRRANINLLKCFPEFTQKRREKYLNEMFAVAPQSLGILAELVLRGIGNTASRTKWHNENIIDKLKKEKRNVIFMVPHGWAVDIPAVLLAAKGNKIAAMFHHQKDPVADYLWNKARYSFGGRLHSREAGIKPFVESVKEGFWGFYLPDQDHGYKNSEFVDFFATHKATLPKIGQLMKICKAAIVPLFPVYNYKTHKLDIYIRDPMEDILGKSDQYVARRMNEELEYLIRPYLEQYAWILKFLKTRQNGEVTLY